MYSIRIRAVAIAVAIGATGACDAGPSAPIADEVAVQISEVSGDEQQGPPGEELPDPIVVRATDDKGHPIRNLLVNFVVTHGGGAVFAGSAITDRQGFAREYWTLGEAIGENRLEVRVVEIGTGAKLVFGEFVAWAVAPPTPTNEVCDGLDNDLDGTADDGLVYCFGGAPAQNTDGAACLSDYFDLDEMAANGCEQRVTGLYALDPALVLSCPVDGAVFTVATAFILGVSEAGMAMRIEPEGFIPVPAIDLLLVHNSATGLFRGTGSFEAGSDNFSSFFVEGTATISVALTAPGTFQGTAQVVAGGRFLGVPFSCTSINAAVVGTLL